MKPYRGPRSPLLRTDAISRWCPIALLLCAASTFFVFGFINGFLPHDWDAGILVAVNISPSNHFLGFYSLVYGGGGEDDVIYAAYNRFPPGGYILIKLVILAFGDDLFYAVYGARALMMAFFAGTLILAYRSLHLLTSSRWIASTVVLMGFTSQLVFDNVIRITIEIAPGLFGFMLAFHGLVVLAQRGRTSLRQAIIKACIALLLDWHVLALLAAFCFLGLVKELLKFARQSLANRQRRVVKRITVVITGSHYLLLGLIALGFGVLILAYNIGNEYYALSIIGPNRVVLSDLPSVESATLRSGISSDYFQHYYETPSLIYFLSIQFRGLITLATPYALDWVNIRQDYRTIMGIIIVVTCGIIGYRLKRHRLLVFTAILSSFCWTIPMRGFVFHHEFEHLYYIGVVLLFFTLVLSLIRRWLGEQFMPLCSVVALLVFALSGQRASHLRDPSEEVLRLQRAVWDDSIAIREFTDGKNVLFNDDTYNLVEIPDHPYYIEWYYYLSGTGLIFYNYNCNVSYNPASPVGRLGDRGADFLLLADKESEELGLLTPDNQLMYLYDRFKYEDRVNRVIEGGQPIIQGDFDVYLTTDRKLIYIKDRCSKDTNRENNIRSMTTSISLNIFPVDVENLSGSVPSKELYSFNPQELLVMDTTRFVLIFDLPDYDIASISTGQYTSEGQVWTGSFFGPDHVADSRLHQRVDQIIDFPQISVVRGYVDVYLTRDRTLMYVREECKNGDVSDGFFVHILPVDMNDLPERRRQFGFDNLDFIFTERGSFDGQRCVAEIRLPDYDIASISTGQHRHEKQLWRSEFSPADA